MPKSGKVSKMNHMTISVMQKLALGGLAAGAALWMSVPVVAQGNGLAMLEALNKGEWTIKQRGGAPDRKICVKSGAELIQLMHRESGCNQFVVEDGAARVTVQYT
jgi:hypothetical protein